MQPPQLTIAIVDDEETIRLSLGRLFSRGGHETLFAATGKEAVELVQQQAPDVMLLDLVLPDLDGIEVLKQIRRITADTAVVMISAHGNVEKTVEAMKEGAENFVTKPIDVRKLEALVETIGKYVKAAREIQFYKQRSGARPLVGTSEHAQKLHQLIDLMAVNVNTTALLLGESGTGKGVVASLIHERSDRRDRPFVEVSCAELTMTLLESELFGHERGAFTDAKELKKGLVEVANGGTLLLDEIGELDLSLQPKLLKFLEGKTFRRVGGVRDISADVRIMAATNADLEAGVKNRTFREDLYYRLNVMPLRLKPLRERADDIPLLVQHFIATDNRSMHKRIRDVSKGAMMHLCAYEWPGNIRELRNVLERAMILAKGESITVAELPKDVLGAKPRGERGPLPSLEQTERDLVAQTLAAFAGNRSRAAKSLGISRSTLHEKMKRYGLG